jgi:hypothetical protein
MELCPTGVVTEMLNAPEWVAAAAPSTKKSSEVSRNVLVRDVSVDLALDFVLMKWTQVSGFVSPKLDEEM